MMIERTKRPFLVALVLALAAPAAVPALAQSAAVQNAANANAEARLRKVEAEVRALQTKVFPGGDGKYFPAQVQPGQPVSASIGAPATTPITDMLGRVDALEAQLARLTAQGEENANKLAKLEVRLAALTPPVPVASDTPAAGGGSTTSENLAAMTGGASASKPATLTPASATTAVRPAAALAAKPTAATKTAGAKPAAASAQRVAAVRAVVKPVTTDHADDEYSYGYRLWEAKFYPEAQQQLKLYLDKYPRHSRVSYARNLLGRAYLDAGNTDEAARWFVANYNASKTGDRAPDSLLLLAETMRQRKDTNRTCIALAQFVDDYPREAAGRLKTQYDATRAGVKCN
jgi:TolA-binding protein